MTDAPTIAIRRSRGDDAGAILAIRRHPATRHYQPLNPGTLADLRRTLSERGALPLAPDTAGKLQWTIEGDRRVAGWITIDITSREHSTASVGYALAPELHGKGIMPIALSRVVPIAFDPERLALERLEAVAAVENVASHRVLEKCGFQFEGIARGLLVIRGERVDHARYGLLRSDMMPQRNDSLGVVPRTA
jgi:ribosomal-protein-alanine N-acetyltransferase